MVSRLSQRAHSNLDSVLSPNCGPSTSLLAYRLPQDVHATRGENACQTARLLAKETRLTPFLRLVLTILHEFSNVRLFEALPLTVPSAYYTQAHLLHRVD